MFASLWQLAAEIIVILYVYPLIFFCDFSIISNVLFNNHEYQNEITLTLGERSGSVVECLTRYRGAAGLSLTSVTALWSLSKTHLS